MKVFVSSTFIDLQKHREALAAALRRMNTGYAAMEDFGSRTDTAVAVCEDEIRRCDVVIGIYAWRYGWQPAPGGPSITEQEYDFAVQCGKRVVCYIVTDTWPWSPAMMETGAAAERLAAFKKRVGSERPISGFTTPDDLTKQVTSDLARELIREDEARRATVSLDQLPLGLLMPELQITLLKLSTRSKDTGTPVSIGELLAALPQQPAAGSTAASAPRLDVSTRFVGRREYFGSLLYDRTAKDYIPFDAEATAIFEQARERPVHELWPTAVPGTSRENFDRFIALCRSVGIIGDDGRVSWPIIGAAVPGQLSAPTRVHLACTNACTFECAHCFAGSGRPWAGELTTLEITTFIDELQALGCFMLSIGGGEPFVRPDLGIILAHAARAGVSVTLSTNAAAATTTALDSWQRASVEMVLVSMDAARPDVYDEMRGEAGAFAKAIAGLERLASRGLPLAFRVVVRRENMSDLAAIVELARKHGVSMVRARPLLPAGRAQQLRTSVLSPSELQDAYASMKSAGADRGVEIDIPEQTPQQRKRAFRGFGCECGQVHCYVGPTGDVSPTGLLRDRANAGNLRSQTLKTIWTTSAVFATWRQLAGNVTCGACEHFAGCRGGCRAAALLVGNDLNQPDPFCPVATQLRIDVA